MVWGRFTLDIHAYRSYAYIAYLLYNKLTRAIIYTTHEHPSLNIALVDQSILTFVAF